MSKNVINTIAEKNNKKNKSRSWLIRVAILLSTVLLTMILCYGVGLYNYEHDTAGEHFGSFDGMFTRVSEIEFEKMKSSDDFEELGLFADSGMIKGDKPMNLYYADKNSRSMVNVDARLGKGRYPEAENEIFPTTSFLKLLHCEDKTIGDTISFQWRPNMGSKYVKKEFVIVGIQRPVGENLEENSGGAFVSKEFFDKNVKTKDFQYELVFRMSEDIEFDIETVESVISDCAARAGLDIDDSGLSINTAYLAVTKNPQTELKAAVALLAICVVLFSMIVIYNIFQVSLVQRMREYGRIKAIGATSKQMKRLINREGMGLALPMVPAGLVIGYIAAYLSFNWLISTSNSVNGLDIHYDGFFSPLAIVVSMFLAFLTVWLAMAKPKRSIARISAVEAIAYRSGVEASGAKRKCAGSTLHDKRNTRKSQNSGLRRGSGNVDITRLAFANIQSDRKQAGRTVLTMGLSCVLLVVTANCLGNIDTDYETRKVVPHGQFQLELDYTFYDEAYPENNLDNILKNNPLNKELIKKLESINGVKDVSYQNILVMEHSDGQLEAMSVLNREDFDFEINKGGTVGEFDYDTASEYGQIIYGWSQFMDDADVKIGDDWKYSLNNGKQTINMSSAVGGSFGSLVGGWGISEDYYKTLGFGQEKSIAKIWIDCDEEDCEAVEAEIRALTGGIEHLDFESYSSNLEQQEFGAKIIKYGLYSLLIIIGFIGFMNMANTMISNITTKKKEYGILQAVGMTDQQLKNTLNIQGMIYIFGTLLVSMLVGIPLGYLAFNSMKKIGGFGLNTYHFPIVELGLIVLVLVLMQLFLSWLLSRNLRKESLIDRIRM